MAKTKNKSVNEKTTSSVGKTGSDEKTVTMKFSADMFYNDLESPLYEKGKTYEVPERMVARWLKRGGKIVDGTEVEEEETTEAIPKDPVEAGEKTSDDGDIRTIDLDQE